MKCLTSLISKTLAFSFVAGLILINPPKVDAQESAPVTPNPTAERWVLEQTAAGNVADLATQFPNEEDRILSVAFLENLIESPRISITRYGIRIRNAVFIEPLDFAFLAANYEVWLEGCKFNHSVDMSESHFSKNLSFRASTFSSWVNFNNLRVDKSLNLSGTDFEDSVDLVYSEIGENLFANDAQFMDADLEAEFNNMYVGGNVFLNRTVFAGPVGFSHTEIGINFEADDAQFTNVDESVNFNTINVGRYVFLRRSVFAGSVDFKHAWVGINFEADDVQFSSENQEADFNTMRVDGTIFLRRAVFAGLVDFKYMLVGSNFDADDVQFSSEKQEADFNSMRVGGSIFLRRAVFAGPVDFGYINVGVDFDASDSRFTSVTERVTFSYMKIEENLYLYRATFDGPVFITNIEVKNNFYANDSEFKSTDWISLHSMKIGKYLGLVNVRFVGPVQLNFAEVGVTFFASKANFLNTDHMVELVDMKVGGSLILVDTVLNGGVNLSDSEYYDVVIKGNGVWAPCPQIKLERTLVRRELDVSSCMADSFNASSLIVMGPAKIENVLLRDSLNLSQTSFNDLTLQDVEFLDETAVILDGIVYNNIHIVQDDNLDDWENLLELVNRSKFNVSTYTFLEEYFVNKGYPERVDRVYVDLKRRERRESLTQFTLLWLWNLFLDIFILYGRSPGRALFWSGMFIIIGSFVFRNQDYMISLSERKILGSKIRNRGTLSRKIPRRDFTAQSEPPYNPFLFSLDLFIPFVDLGFDNKWVPKSDHKWRVVYSKLHMLAGWLLIPIGLLALTGIIK